jgi:membrane protein YqaA with SNARE-associated domain
MSSLIRPLYDWTLRLSGHRHAVWALALVSFAESSFFPIPPDILLIPMILAARHRAFQLAFICTASSVLGGYFGYAIGYFLFDSLGRQVFVAYGIMNAYEHLKADFDQYGAWIIMIKGMTPIPYKLLTIASGVTQFDLLSFTIASFVSRSLRFFLVAALLWKFGEPIRTFIEKRLMLLTTLFAVALIGGFVVIKLLL